MAVEFINYLAARFINLSGGTKQIIIDAIAFTLLQGETQRPCPLEGVADPF